MKEKQEAVPTVPMNAGWSESPPDALKSPQNCPQKPQKAPQKVHIEIKSKYRQNQFFLCTIYSVGSKLVELFSRSGSGAVCFYGPVLLYGKA